MIDRISLVVKYIYKFNDEEFDPGSG